MKLTNLEQRRLIMIKDRERGATLSLLLAVTLTAAMLGIAFFFLVTILGGMRELQHATDSGNLNVAKQSIRKPALSLNAGVEQNNFAGLVDINGKIDLLDYNRLFAQALIVALNAQAEDTGEAKQHAQTLLAALQADSTSIGKRLLDALSNPQSQTGAFTKLANDNTVRMLNNSSKVAHVDAAYQVAYLHKGGATNVYLDPTILPAGATLPTNAFSAKTAANGQKYLAGYKDLSVDSLNQKSISGVPMQPGDRPHLVSQLTFNADLRSQVSNIGVPPNTFKSAGSSLEKTSGALVNAISCAIVSAGQQDYPACIPRGYICITNLPGLTDNSPLPSNESIFNNQLYTGIFLGVAEDGAVSFSTDEDLMLRWVAYNNHPGLIAKPSGEGIYGADPSGIKSLGGNGYPPEVDYTMVSGPGAIPKIAALLPLFKQAYPAPNGQPGHPEVLTAVEYEKGAVMSLFASGQPGVVSDPQGDTGLRLFDHSKQYPVGPGESPRFTRSGTVPQLLAQVGSGADSVIWDQLVERIREIKPDATLPDINKLFADNLLEMGSTLYVYELNGALTLTETPPPWIVADTIPDGIPQNIFSIYETIGLSVNPPGEGGLKNVMFEQTPNPATNGIGRDEAIWTPSSGFNNLLGVLQFQESVGNVLVANNPPMAPTPPVTPATPVVPVAPLTPIPPVVPPQTPSGNCAQLLAAAAAAIQLSNELRNLHIFAAHREIEKYAMEAIQAARAAGCGDTPYTLIN